MLQTSEEDRVPSPFCERLVWYAYIEPLLVGRRVLEVGAGHGEGAMFLAARAAEVLAFEPETRLWQAASGAGERPNLAFTTGDPSRWGEAEGSFDLLLVPELQRWIGQRELLGQLLALLRREGVALFAAPHAEVCGAHRGLSCADFSAHLAPHFAHVRLCGDLPFRGRIVAEFEPETDLEPALDCSLVAEDVAPTALLALCSNVPVVSLGYAVLQVPSDPRTPPDQVAPAVAREFGRLSRQAAELRALRQIDHWRIDELRGHLCAKEAEQPSPKGAVRRRGRKSAHGRPIRGGPKPKEADPR